MTALIKRLSAKLKSKRGESLTEVLVAVVVGGLSTLMLAMGISVSANVNDKSDEAMEGYYTANNTIVEGSATLSNPTTGKATLKPATGAADIASSEVDVVYTIGEQVNGESIISYEAKPSG